MNKTFALKLHASPGRKVSQIEIETVPGTGVRGLWKSSITGSEGNKGNKGSKGPPKGGVKAKVPFMGVAKENQDTGMVNQSSARESQPLPRSRG